MESLIQTCGIIVILAIHCSQASWTSPNSRQYHIQTDEGPERYFRFLTDNGQYRKEKRLQDGTVIGTDAWIDASGFLRQKDYIADGAGYRILKSKTVYVGKDQPIDDAMRSLKSGHSSHDSDNVIKAYQTTDKPLLTNYIPTTTPTWLYYDHPSTPVAYVSSKSQPIKNNYEAYTSRPVSNPIQALVTSTALNGNHDIPSLKLQPPFSDLESTISVSPLNRNQYDPISTAYPTSVTSLNDPYAINTELLSPINKNSLADNSLGFNEHISTTPTPIAFTSAKEDVLPIASNDLEQQPLYSRPNIARQYSARNPFRQKFTDYNSGSGYEAQLPQYDGVSVSNNGFRYYLPRQYHEEENSDSQHRTGSFGYIDPFGIRRVTYYNASPEQGFLHKKNNRYVGFNATPYDPRPI